MTTNQAAGSPLPAEASAYLRRLRAGLAPLPEREREEIALETESHLRDRLAESGAAAAPQVAIAPLLAALAALGEPEEYAARFVANYRLSAALASGSSPALVGQILRGLGTGVGAFLGGLALLVLYSLAAGLLAVAVIKPILPGATGLFIGADGSWGGLGLIDPASRAGARELLGYWLIPLALATGALLGLLAGRLARWYLRTLRGRHDDLPASASRIAPR